MGRGAVSGWPLLLLAMALPGCNPSERQKGKINPPPAAASEAARNDPALAEPFTEAFDSGTLDPGRWNATADAYRIAEGELVAQDARNRPLWLKRRLPCDVQLELDVWSDSPDGDIKFEVMGDGASWDPDQGSYLATGYVFILGGWRNSISTIARQDEHQARLVVDDSTRVEQGRRYHVAVRFEGGRIDWSLDGQPFLSVTDPAPLCGPGHDHFGINNWAVPLHFDNLVVTPLGPPPAPPAS